MNALELLKSDHQKVSELFDQLQQATDFEQKRDIFDSIRDELTVHTQVEESVFYPAFQDREGFGDLIESAIDEHAEVKDILDEIDTLEDESDLEDRFDELQEAVDHHVAEEENELFPKILQVMNEKELDDLGQRLIEAKRMSAQAA